MSKDNNELIIDENDSVNEVKVEEKKVAKKVEKKQQVKKQEVKKATPFLFFKKDDKIEISIDGYHSKETGELQFTLLSDGTEQASKDLQNLFTKVVYKFWFTRCPYNKLNQYRSRSMIYNSEDQNNTINQLRLREFFLVYHLVDWDLKDENGEKVPLKFDPSGALSDQTLEMIYTLPSILIDTVLAAYQKKAVIS